MTPDPQEQAPDLDVIEKYCDAATAGPWILTWLRTALCEGIANSAKSVLCYLPQPQRNWQGETDMKFCVNARTDLPALVKYTRSLQARLAEAERDKWLPIDTAPRDTNLIGAMLVDGRPVRACMIYWGDIGWYEPYSGKSAHYVTHWLQIPGH